MKKINIYNKIPLFAGLIALLAIWVSSCDGGEDFVHVPLPIEAHTITKLNPANGSVGAVITIKGSNFSLIRNNNKVRFNGGVLAVVTQATVDSLLVEVPTGAKAGPITISHYDLTVTGPEFTVDPTTITIAIDDADDDVEEAVDDGSMSLTSGDLELGETEGGSLKNIGLRFNDIQIPKDVNILSASIQFTADNDGSDPTEMTIFGENTGNSEAYVSDDNNLSNRTLTTASEVWSIPEWLDSGDKLEAQRTVDIKSIIQEIIDRDDWEAGNSLNIIMKPSGVSAGVTSSSGGREAESATTDEPEIIITYL